MRDLTNIILNNKYQFLKKIGSGSYGIVYSARHLYTGKTYAIKIILKNQCPSNNNKQLLLELENELLNTALENNGTLITNLLNLDLIERNGFRCKILKEISLQLKVHKHPNILSLYKVYDCKNALFVVMDYYPDGDLFNTIVEKQRYKNDPFLVKAVFIQLVDAINYCHSKGVYHCDLKPENILVTNNGTKLILADFGLALQDKYIDSNICCGSSYYMSPERIQNFCQAFDSKDAHSIHLERLMKPSNEGLHENVAFPTGAGDVWSLAIILINLISIRNPWLKASLQDTTFKAFVKDPEVLMKILPISREVFTILCKYLALNPWERGNLFEFRQDILNCTKLSETGPLSINSRIDSIDIISTQSQQQLMEERFDVCSVPVDHVRLNKMRSRENSGIENVETETNYIIDLPFLTDEGQNQREEKNKKCGSCVNCGYGSIIPETQPHLSPPSHKLGVFNKIFGKKNSHPSPSPSTSPSSAASSQPIKAQKQHHQHHVYTSKETDFTNAPQPYYPTETQKIKVDSLLSDYKAIFPSPTSSEHVKEASPNHSQSIANASHSSTSYKSGITDSYSSSMEIHHQHDRSGSTSSNSSENIEVIIHADATGSNDDEGNLKRKMEDMNHDLSMVSIMSVKNSCSTYMSFDY